MRRSIGRRSSAAPSESQEVSGDEVGKHCNDDNTDDDDDDWVYLTMHCGPISPNDSALPALIDRVYPRL
jgi:hypothetical protein